MASLVAYCTYSMKMEFDILTWNQFFSLKYMVNSLTELKEPVLLLQDQYELRKFVPYRHCVAGKYFLSLGIFLIFLKLKLKFMYMSTSEKQI